jgi:hypothetical protein
MIKTGDIKTSDPRRTCVTCGYEDSGCCSCDASPYAQGEVSEKTSCAYWVPVDTIKE